MAAMHSQLYRDFHIRFEREPGSRYVDIYMPGLPEPITIGITDFIATSADASAVIADFHAEQRAVPPTPLYAACRGCERIGHARLPETRP